MSVWFYLWRSWRYPLQASDCCSNIYHCRALVMVSLEHKADSLIAKIQRSGRNGQRDWCMSRVTAIISAWLSISSSACHGLLIIYRDNATYKKAQRAMSPENWSWWTRHHADASAWCCCVDAKYTKELADAKAENDALRWCCRWSSSVAHQAVCQSVREATTASPAWIMQPPPDWQTPLNGIISPSERGWSLCKNNWRNPEVY